MRRALKCECSFYTAMEVLQCEVGSTMVSYLPFHLVLEAFGGNLRSAGLGASTESEHVHLCHDDVLTANTRTKVGPKSQRELTVPVLSLNSRNRSCRVAAIIVQRTWSNCIASSWTKTIHIRHRDPYGMERHFIIKIDGTRDSFHLSQDRLLDCSAQRKLQKNAVTFY